MGIKCIDRTKILTLLILITTPVVMISLLLFLNPMGIADTLVEFMPMLSGHRTTTSREYLLIKIVLHPALSKYIKTESSYKGKAWSIGDFVIIKRHSLDQVTLIVGNKTLGEFKLDELKGVTRNITTTIYGYPVTALITVRSMNISLFSLEFPQEAAHLKDKVLKILEKSAFIKLLKSLRIEYYISDVSPLRHFSRSEPSTLIIDGASITMNLKSENHALIANCFVMLKTPCKLYISGMPKEFAPLYPFAIPSKKPSKLLITYIEDIRKGSSIGVYQTPSTSSQKTPRKLNITEEYKEKIMEIISKNKITAKLLKSGAKVERIIINEEEKHPGEWRRWVAVILTWPETTGLRVDIFIINDTIREISVIIRES